MSKVGVRALLRTAVGLQGAAAVLAFAAASYAAEDYEPKMSTGAKQVPYEDEAFKSDPSYADTEYDVGAQLEIYGGKTSIDPPRPLFELGQPQYVAGQLPEPSHAFGKLNPSSFAFQAFGDWRTAFAYNDFGDNELGQIATRLNLDLDFKLTATERLHTFIRPIDSGENFTRCELFGNDKDEGCELESDLNLETLFFEGDLAAIAAGFTGEYYSQDMPFTVGLVPLFFQNGIWVNDAVLGGAYTVPALNSPLLDISNMDFTFFAGFDEITNDAIVDQNGNVAAHNVNVYGAATFIEVLQGYIEAGVGYLDTEDNRLGDADIVSLTAAWSSRYQDLLSYSFRAITSRQDRDDNLPTLGTGTAFLLETSWMTSQPYTLLPYANFWFGINRPQPLSNVNGLLINTGINFETDALTGYPFLDDTAADTFGGAVGLQYLFDYDQQIIVEAASVQQYGGQSNVNGDQYALGVRWQLPITKAWILRADAMYGLRDNDDNIGGVRFEVRRKF